MSVINTDPVETPAGQMRDRIRLRHLDACLEHLPTGGRLVANAVTVESEAVVAQAYSRLGGTLQRFQHYHGESLGGFTGWRPRLPITQWQVTG